MVEPLPRWTDWQVTASSVPARKRDAQHAKFTVKVPAGGEAVDHRAVPLARGNESMSGRNAADTPAVSSNSRWRAPVNALDPALCARSRTRSATTS